MMQWFVKNFIRASLVWLSLGVTLGVAMAVNPLWVVYRPAHMHMVMLGFVTMMIFGVAYHMLPRIAGNPLHNTRAATVHWWLSNLGLACMVAGFFLRVSAEQAGRIVLATGGMMAASGAYIFAWLIWRSMNGDRRERARAERAAALGRTALPVVES